MKQEAADEFWYGLVGSEMCIRDESERISATQKLPEITAQLLKELKRDGVDIDNARKVSDARDLAPDENDIAEILQTLSRIHI